MILQSAFIGNFYLNRKFYNFEENFKSFKTSYDKNPQDASSLWTSMNSFETNNNANITMYNLPYQQTYSYTHENGFYISDSPYFSNYDRTIKAVMLECINNAQYLSKIKNGETVVFKSKYEINGINAVVAVTPIVVNNTINTVFVAISSLQPIGEASSVIKEFYVYFYVLAIVLIIILSLVYTNMITNPLKKLNKTALKMSQLDFTEKCNVTTKDEIGSLATTLNFLSYNLGNSLNALQTANEKLTKDIEKEKALERMRKEFVAGVSHELKTPISLINGYAEGLKDNIAEGEEKDYYLDVIMDESQKMSILISDMLDLSQLESGNFKLDEYYFEMEELIASIVKKHATIFEAKNISIKVNIATKSSEVFGDSFRIEQVITNLLGNAIKNTPQGEGIFISLSQVEEEILFEIENHGTQIPVEDLENIWEKFYKVEKSRNRVLGGTGIGLSIVKNILSLHKSNFGVENTETGVKFYFFLKKQNNS
ncbi:MAG: HAMP domain-containing protein [Clostridiaceae bacterium]|nr:HAMP domain-containing protein [Clostridiaceae bacterium]